MSIRQRGKSWVVDIKDINGKRIRKTYKTKKKAEIAISQMRINNSKGFSNVVNESITLKEACEDFLNNHIKIYSKQSTIDEYTRIINNVIIPKLGHKKLISLNKIDVEDFMNSLIIKNLSNATINKYKMVLGSIIQRQVNLENIFKNIVIGIKNLKVSRHKARALNKEEINLLLTTCKKIMPNFYLMLFTMLNTGMRRGEILALEWDNIDFDKNQIKIVYSEYKGKKQTPKSECSKRIIYITKRLALMLKEQKLKVGANALVFPNSEGNMFIGDNIERRYFKPVMHACNIGTFRMHDIRHTFGSQLIEGGANIKYVSEQMGHASIKTTLDVYTHVLSTSSKKAISIMDELYVVA